MGILTRLKALMLFTVLVFLAIQLNFAVTYSLVVGSADSSPVIDDTGSEVSGTHSGAGYSDRFSMSYIYFGSSGAYTQLVDRTNGSVHDISPSYFDLNSDGSLMITKALDRKFIKDMHDRGIKVTPFLSNHWDRQKGINALNNREKLSDQIAAAVLEYDLDGVNVDIENVTGNERDIYTDFVRLLRQKLPAGKTVSVAVAPNLYANSSEWHSSYDNAGLAKYSDYLMLMAYDEHYQGGSPGPVAGYTFVENCIKAALKEISADKLVLGIPFYGRYWRQGDSYGGYGISNSTIAELIAKYNGRVVYDHGQQSPKAVITIKETGEKPVVYGRTLKSGKYEIWYENETSIKKKLELVEKYNLKGAGSWSLGQETADTWDYYLLWLNGIYFKDIQKHWAKESIAAVYKKGWMKGMSVDHFMPDAPVTRAQAAVLLVRILGMKINGINTAGSAFSDISGHWARTEIEAAWENGLVEGTGKGKFEPDAELTREQMAVLLDRIINGKARHVKNPARGNEVGGLQKDPVQGTSGNTIQVTRQSMAGGMKASAGFSDVSPMTSRWSYETINRMAEAGLLKGFPDGKFRPGDAISRGQIAVLAERCF